MGRISASGAKWSGREGHGPVELIESSRGEERPTREKEGTVSCRDERPSADSTLCTSFVRLTVVAPRPAADEEREMGRTKRRQEGPRESKEGERWLNAVPVQEPAALHSLGAVELRHHPYTPSSPSRQGMEWLARSLCAGNEGPEATPSPFLTDRESREVVAANRSRVRGTTRRVSLSRHFAERPRLLCWN